jgi:sulfite oxidase
MTSSRAVSRRAFLRGALRVGAGAALLRGVDVPVLAAQNASDAMIVHSARPQDLETPVNLLTSWITPNNLFYVRSHFYTPSIRQDAWILRIDGDVKRPLTLTMDAIAQMPSKTLAVTLECAGNGRGFYDPPVAGVQWRKGAVGTARWTGVPLAAVLHQAGISPSAKYLWLDGADTGLGRAPDFIRSLPIDKAVRGDALLAYEMNGEPLPAEHGYPLRVIVPGWEGAYSVKWLVHITASDRDHEGAFVTTAYRMPRVPVAPGTNVTPDATVPIRELMVKSIITSPADGSALLQGRTAVIGGFAWSGGGNEIRRVDVSIDRGRTWAVARLGQDRAPYAWRRFELPWRPTEPGSFIVLSRAADVRGRTQPLAAQWNPGGYAWDAIDQVRVNVQAA